MDGSNFEAMAYHAMMDAKIKRRTMLDMRMIPIDGTHYEEYLTILPSDKGRLDLSELHGLRSDEEMLKFVLDNPAAGGFFSFKKPVVWHDGKRTDTPLELERSPITYVGRTFTTNQLLDSSGGYGVIRYGWLRDEGYSHAVMLDGGKVYGLKKGDIVYDRHTRTVIFEMGVVRPTPRTSANRADPDAGVN